MAAFRAASMRASMSARFCEIVMAANLARSSGAVSIADMPLVLMTDDAQGRLGGARRAACRAAAWWWCARATAKQRLALAEQLHGIAPLLIADDPALAAQIGAAGLHLPEARMKEAAHWRARFPHWIITSSAHSLRALMGAQHAGCGVPVAGLRHHQP